MKRGGINIGKKSTVQINVGGGGDKNIISKVERGNNTVSGTKNI
jgi:hypothetical protein